jgi:hypothetical protein
MRLKVSKDAELLNRVINHPSVFPFVSLGYDSADVTPLLQMDTTVFLATEHGGFLFVQCGDGLYEVHTQFLPEGRAGVLALAREAGVYMFSRTPALAVTTFVADGNERARGLTLAMGFREIGPKSINGYDGKGYLLTIKDWVCQQFQQS